MVHKSNYCLSKNAKKSRLNDLLNWVDENADEMLGNPANGLEAIGVGRKNMSYIDQSEGDWCIVGFVKRKLAEKKMAKENMIPFEAVATAMSSAVTTPKQPEMDVVETGGAFSIMPGLSIPVAQRGAFGGPPPSVDFQKRFDVLRSGIGITNPVGSYPNSLSVGTLGFFVKDDNDRIYLVSNNHVIGRENSAQIGNAVVQPGTLDLTQTELNTLNTLPKLRNALQIAKVSAVVDIDFGVGLNEVDIAIAELGANRSQSLLSRIGYGSTARGLATPYTVDQMGNVVGETRVYKSGRTTGWTEGQVSSIGVAVNVQYGKGVARFRNQIAIVPTADNDGPFSDRGDSGSGVWDIDNNLVGLLFAGSPSRTLINPVALAISAVENELNKGPLTLVT